MTGELAWLTDIDPAVVAWAIVPEKDQSANSQEFQHGHLHTLLKSEFKDLQAGKQE
jgi:hypothetical protein|tara:strand:- start:1758 stop:1925 length:168 start_codon:yes stop_codon:yes gene_type:complete